jgi:hypothetical protein
MTDGIQGLIVKYVRIGESERESVVGKNCRQVERTGTTIRS